jgi:CDP-diacylglycerol--inositol 3-phosphatidyltransferase
MAAVYLASSPALITNHIVFPIPSQLFLFLMILDISSHWCQMYSSSLAKAGAHHKSEAGNEGRHIIVQWFYKYYWFFGYLCVGAEFTYICLYVVRHASSNGLVYIAARALLWACIPGCAAKQFVNLMQLTSACYIVAEHDAKERNARTKNKE